MFDDHYHHSFDVQFNNSPASNNLLNNNNNKNNVSLPINNSNQRSQNSRIEVNDKIKSSNYWWSDFKC